VNFGFCFALKIKAVRAKDIPPFFSGTQIFADSYRKAVPFPRHSLKSDYAGFLSGSFLSWRSWESALIRVQKFFL
jgi:hypothetical protein